MSTSHDRPSAQQGANLSSTAHAGLWLYLVLGSGGVFVLIMMLVVNDPFTAMTLIPGALLMFLATWWFGSGKVVVNDAGVRVYGGSIMKLLEVKTAAIASAEAKEISPAEYGGWGLRISGAGAAFILKKGPGLVVHRKQGSPRVYSVASIADAELMAAELNHLVARNEA